MSCNQRGVSYDEQNRSSEARSGKVGFSSSGRATFRSSTIAMFSTATRLLRGIKIERCMWLSCGGPVGKHLERGDSLFAGICWSKGQIIEFRRQPSRSPPPLFVSNLSSPWFPLAENSCGRCRGQRSRERVIGCAAPDKIGLARFGDSKF